MLQHILVPLDGSLLSESALPVAVFFARTLNASVTLVHVIEKNAPEEKHGQMHLRNATQAEKYLKEVAQRFFQSGIHIQYHVHTSEVKNVAKSIVAHEGELDYDLVIMCTHGRGRTLHLFLGSIAQQVIGQGDKPVLMVHPAEQQELPSFSCYSILLPMDANSQHLKALEVAREFANACQANIHLIMVIETFTTLSGQSSTTSKYLPRTMTKMLEMSTKDAEEYLGQLQQQIMTNGLKVTSEVLRGDPADIIVRSAQTLGVDLIILGTHGKSGMDAFWSGSVTNKVCSECKIPLLLVPVSKDKDAKN